MANELSHDPVEELVNECDRLIKRWSSEGRNSLATAENCFEKNSAAYKTMHSIGSAYIFCAHDLKNVLNDLKFQTSPIPETQTLQDPKIAEGFYESNQGHVSLFFPGSGLLW